jgi:acetyltransferase-like isoleucine patch superfamily enzyme
MSNGRDTFLKVKMIINILIKINNILPFSLRVKLFDHHRMATGKKGIFIRYILLKTIAKECGDNVSIQPGVYIFNPQNLVIGNNVSIHPMCYIEAHGGVSIGNEVSIAHSTSILSVNHTWNRKDISIKYNDIEEEQISIGNDVWIGCGARILAGVTVNSRSIIAAGAVVSKEVLSNTIVGGVPAKKIKDI